MTIARATHENLLFQGISEHFFVILKRQDRMVSLSESSSLGGGMVQESKEEATLSEHYRMLKELIEMEHLFVQLTESIEEACSPLPAIPDIPIRLRGRCRMPEVVHSGRFGLLMAD